MGPLPKGSTGGFSKAKTLGVYDRSADPACAGWVFFVFFFFSLFGCFVGGKMRQEPFSGRFWKNII